MIASCVYFTFNGNCQEAMLFYQKCFGGELELELLGEMKNTTLIPPAMHKLVSHSSLKNEKLVVMGTDLVENSQLIHGNSVATMISCENESQFNEISTKLALNGKIIQAISTNLWGNLTTDITDKFGNHWLIRL